MTVKKVNRRRFLSASAIVMTGVMAAACKPKVVEVEKIITKEVERIVKETIIVEGTPKVVERVVKETVVVEKEVTAAPAKVEAVTLRHAGRSGPEGDMYTERAPDFEKQYPNIKIKQELTPHAEYHQKLAMNLAAGTQGDTWWVPSIGGYFRYANKGLSLPIDALIDAKGYDRGVYYTSVLDAARFKGKLHGLPWICHPGRTGIFYNKTLFDEAGVELPPADGSWDTDDLVERAKALTKDTTGDGKIDQFGFRPGSDVHSALIWFRAWGGYAWNADGTKFLLDTPEARAALQWMVDLYHKHHVAPTPEEVIDRMFETGKVAMFQSGYWGKSAKGRIGDRFEMSAAPVPKGPAGIAGSMAEFDPICISSTSKHIDEAFEWLKWLASKETGIRIAEVGHVPGGRPDVWDSPRLTKDPMHMVMRLTMVNAMELRKPANFSAWEVRDAFGQGMGNFWLGKTTVEEVVPKVQEACQKIMDQPAG